MSFSPSIPLSFHRLALSYTIGTIVQANHYYSCKPSAHLLMHGTNIYLVSCVFGKHVWSMVSWKWRQVYHGSRKYLGCRDLVQPRYWPPCQGLWMFPCQNCILSYYILTLFTSLLTESHNAVDLRGSVSLCIRLSMSFPVISFPPVVTETVKHWSRTRRPSRQAGTWHWLNALSGTTLPELLPHTALPWLLSTSIVRSFVYFLCWLSLFPRVSSYEKQEKKPP